MRANRRRTLKLAGCGLAAVSVGVPAAASSHTDGWRKPQSDASNTATASAGPSGGVETDWSSGFRAVGTPVVADGTAYAAAPGGTLRAIDAATGETVWSYDAGDGFGAPPSYHDGSVYVTAGTVTHAVDAATGEARWTRRATSASVSPANAGDGAVFVGVSNTLYALGVHTGTVLWREGVGGPLAGAPAVRDGTVYAATEGGDLYAFETDGGIEWRAGTGASAAGPPVASDDGVFTVGGRGGVRAFTHDGDESWSEPLTAEVSVPHAVDLDHVYVATEDAVHALRTSSGWEEWVYETDGEPARPSSAAVRSTSPPAVPYTPSTRRAGAGGGRTTASRVHSRSSAPTSTPATEPSGA
jgi:outer membrane protein assembly factor BamB